jgi:hypothetical protein
MKREALYSNMFDKQPDESRTMNRTIKREYWKAGPMIRLGHGHRVGLSHDRRAREICRSVTLNLARKSERYDRSSKQPGNPQISQQPTVENFSTHEN